MAAKSIPWSEVEKHKTKSDCWTVIHGKVYDLTTFLPEHPGGASIILKYAGKDATKAFDPIHPSDIIEKLLPPSVCLGSVEPRDLKEEAVALSEDERRVQLAHQQKPSLDAILNLFDFEAVAKHVMASDGWAYYSSAADDEITARENRQAFQRIWFRPRVLINVRQIDPSASLLGHASSLPIYITATALGKLGHPEGELVLTRAAGRQGIIQMIPTLSSFSLDEITAARVPGQVQFFQLYVNSNRSITEKLIRQAERRGCQGLFITVDAPTLAKREKDMRMKFLNRPPDVQNEGDINRNQGAARAIASFIDPSLNWTDLKWFQSVTTMPIVLKGIQCGEDAVLAAKAGVQGIVVSNHGGRQLDFARSGIEVLAEVMAALRQAGLQNKLEVYMDGGVRRGTDVLKAVALGAKAVGLGRPFLYAMSSYGQPGVERAIEILRDEIEMGMRLLGVTHLKDLNTDYLCTQNLKDHISVVPKDYLQATVYEKMQPPKSKL